MASDLAQIVNGLTERQQEAVRKFIEFLKAMPAGGEDPFNTAVDEFVDSHPELLRRLAQ